MKVSDPILKKIASGYARLALAALAWIGASAVAVAAAAAVVWPLWALAVNRTAVYNAAFLALAGACALAAIAFSVKRRIGKGESPAKIAGKALAFLGLCLAWAALVLSLYLAFAFASRGFVVGAVPAGLAFVALAGYLFFGRKRAK